MFKTIWRGWLADRLAKSLEHRVGAALLAPTMAELSVIRNQIEEVAEHGQAQGRRLADLAEKLSASEVESAKEKPWLRNLHPSPIALHPKLTGPFMQHSTCSTADFLHAEFERLSGLLGLETQYHRKFWEWVFILHHGLSTGAVGPGKRCLGFAVGTEPLPSAFAAAGASVTATDAPADVGIGTGWKTTSEYASQASDLHKPGVVDRAAFDRLVTFRPCDMTAIPADLTGFDFCWSACSFEHLGTLGRGLDFVQETVERTLRPGGVAVHTTEFNWSSDTATVEGGPTVLYRRSDLTAFLSRMERRGHTVEPLRIAPDSHVLDFYADTAPYSMPVHLKLKLLGYVSTSVGLVITRGP